MRVRKESGRWPKVISVLPNNRTVKVAMSRFTPDELGFGKVFVSGYLYYRDKNYPIINLFYERRKSHGLLSCESLLFTSSGIYPSLFSYK